MHNPLRDLPDTESLLIFKEDYEELCAIHDKLLLLAQLAGDATINGENDALLFIRRNLLGQLFADLSFQISDVLDAVARTATQGDKVLAH